MVSMLTYWTGNLVPLRPYQPIPMQSLVYLCVMSLCKSNFKKIFCSLFKYLNVTAAFCCSVSL